MPIYHSLGQIPHKRHTQFRQPDGALYSEQLMGSKGFSGMYSLLYHSHPPTRVTKIGPVVENKIEFSDKKELKHYHFKTKEIEAGGDPITGRKVFMANEDVSLAIARPTQKMSYFYRNGQADELYFIHEGSGVFQTIFGRLTFRPGDYVIIPRGTTYKIVSNPGPNRFLVIESPSQIETPRRYRNEHGQLLEHSPYCERDIRRPEALETFDEKGEFEVKIKARNRLTTYVFDFHPLDVVGWDGYLYPWIFNIEDFEPITGRIHQPPPVHQTFEGHNFVVCSFCPRKFDYHPLAVPIPYNHSNVESDEMLYYCNAEFMSRKDIEYASITLHPSGIPHGPHPGAVESALGKERTNELAVMMDTFRPLSVTKLAEKYEDDKYAYSWL